MSRHAIATTVALLCAAAAPGQRADTDGDGLSDYHETHKYGTNPKKADSDGDGIPDGDWRERREYAYTVRAVIQVKAPYDKATLVDDYQDVRILDEGDDHVELEVVLYPFNTNRDAIGADRNWRRNAAKMAAYRKPGVTTNWDLALRKDLLRRLKRDGIDVAKLTDKQVVERVAKWALDHAKFVEMFTTYAVHYPGGKPAVDPELRGKFDNGKGNKSWSDAEQMQRELFGAGMYRNRTRGTCTSSAIYMTTIMRAVGIPCRMIVGVPIVNACDDRNREMVSRLGNHEVRRRLERSVENLENSFAAHTFNEVWVDGRWRRLNYSRLGANVLEVGMGLIVRVHTFLDHSESGLSAGWGSGKRRTTAIFRRNNPYHALTLGDRFGVHCTLENPTAAGDHKTLTIGKAYWFQSRQRPKGIDGNWDGARNPREGHLLVHVEERDRGDDARQYNEFHAKVDKEFELAAKGHPRVRAVSLACWWTLGSGAGTVFYLRIPEKDYRRIRKGVRYRLRPRNRSSGYSWMVAGDVVVRQNG